MSDVATPRDALDAIVLGNLMKSAGAAFSEGDPASVESFSRVLQGTRESIRRMSDRDVKAQVLSCDPASRRPEVFPMMRWTWEFVNLDHCLVWPEMGSRSWARGSVPEVSSMIESGAYPNDSLVAFRRKFPIDSYGSMPPIAVRLDGCYRPLGLDDGNHRAVAAYLNGVRQVRALVGSGHAYYQDEFRHYRVVRADRPFGDRT